ncbi:hypothetical protein PZ897_15175 [Hoeflea sp. YIM 152468]|uniref:hypothetical protein n=1 Tax=Hoeflea sp. YIM 152468 TaxID=3031759 RepID=UPI0023D9D161|nr:hypothetical protein [Hoeflea sp. YIM 152468]MDF1609527.1 hypothetical protein [Hoeflea sp. YIM 152468]
MQSPSTACLQPGLNACALSGLRMGILKPSKQTLPRLIAFCVNVLGYQGGIEAVSRDFKRNPSFGRGEMMRAVLDVLRKAQAPKLTRDLTVAVFESKGLTLPPGQVGKDRINRVRKICQQVPGICEAGNGRRLGKWECRP